MAGLRVTKAADGDVDHIYETIRSAAGAKAAEALDRSLDVLFVRLTEFPESGAPRPSLGRGIRIGVVRPYVILYRYNKAEDVVEILRIVHGHRNIVPAMLRR